MSRYVTNSLGGLGRLLVTALSIFAFAFALAKNYWILAVASLLMGSFSAWWDLYGAKRRAAQQQMLQEALLLLAKKQLDNNEWKILQIFAKPRWFLTLFVFIAAILFTFLSHEFLVKLSSVVIALYACFLLFLKSANCRTPFLELDSTYINLPVIGKVTWSDCLGVSLSTETIRSASLHFLCLKLHRPIKIKWSFSTVALYAMHLRYGQARNKKLSNVIRVRLDNLLRYDPKIISELATLLWQKNTGKNYFWYESMSDELLGLQIRRCTLEKEIDLKNKNLIKQFANTKANESELKAFEVAGSQLEKNMQELIALNDQISMKTKAELRFN